MQGEYGIRILILKQTLNQNQNLISMKLHLKRALHLKRTLILKRTMNLYQNLSSMKLHLKRALHLRRTLILKRTMNLYQNLSSMKLHLKRTRHGNFMMIMNLHFREVRFQRGGSTIKVLEVPYHSRSVGNFHHLLSVLHQKWNWRIMCHLNIV